VPLLAACKPFASLPVTAKAFPEKTVAISTAAAATISFFIFLPRHKHNEAQRETLASQC
jgi:hypothetical protein